MRNYAVHSAFVRWGAPIILAAGVLGTVGFRFGAERNVRATFRLIDQQDYETLLEQTAPSVLHVFPGDHALGGTRHSRDALRRWFQRIFLLFPELRFEVKEVAVRGLPWDATVMVQWENRGRACDGQPYANQGAHVLRLRRGRVIYLHEYLDSQRMAEVCRRLARRGLSEAAAEPVTDRRR
jgi:ketosteroid isomerase-like protein